MALKSGVLLQHKRYQIMEQLGEGGMATVYLAADRNLPGRTVAIKENDVTTTSVQAQFRREAVILARLSHPNLPKVTDHFIEPSGYQYLVMDYVAGDNLQQRTMKQRGFVPEPTAIDWISQVCDALTYMHTWTERHNGTRTPVLHRDIKPSNIKCTPDGHIVLVDFGLVKFQDGNSVGTSVGARAYTAGYAPIEQYTGGTDVRSDVYAVGATLYSILTGKKPPPSPSIANGTKLVLPRQINPDISTNTEQVILQAMSIAPSKRYQTAAEMKMALNMPADGADEAVTQPLTEPLSTTGAVAGLTTDTYHRRPAQPIGNRSQDRALPIWTTLVALLALVGLGITLWYFGGSRIEQSTKPVSSVTVTDSATGLSASAIVSVTKETPTSLAVADTITSTITFTVTSPITLAITPTITPAVTSTAISPATVTPSSLLATDSTPASALSTVARTAPPKIVEAGAQWIHPQTEAAYLFIPGGEFTMGSDDSRNNEGPAHLVRLDNFWIMQTEVTNQQYQRCVAADKCTEPSNEIWLDPAFANHPVTHIDWAQAVEYALSVGGRLPTEAEWEKAARGDDSRAYPWGDDQPAKHLLNYRFEVTIPTAVGQYEVGASPYGVLDMAGNVEEWVHDWYYQSYYEESPTENPRGPDDGVMRVVRGGSFHSNPLDVRTTARGKAIPTSSAYDSVGFRVVIDIVE